MLIRVNILLARNPWLFGAVPALAQITYILLDHTHAYMYLGVLSEIGLKTK